MNDCPKKDRNRVERKTKAQLGQELAETRATLQMEKTRLLTCEKELRKARGEVKELLEKSERAEAEMQQAQKVMEENEELRKRLQEIEEDSSSQIQEATRNLHEAERQSQQLEKEIETLKEKLAGDEEKSEAPAKFRVHFYPREGHYRGQITSIPVYDDPVSFDGVDAKAISDYISERLPALPGEEKTSLPTAEPAETSARVEPTKISELRKTDARAPSKTKPPKPPAEFKEIRFQQLKRFLEPGRPLRAHRPFRLFTRLHLPVMPTANNLDIDTTTYDIGVIATDVTRENVIARNRVADTLYPGIMEYENQVDMAGLAPGKYSLRIFTFAPFARIEGEKDLEVIVE